MRLSSQSAVAMPSLYEPRQKEDTDTDAPRSSGSVDGAQSLRGRQIAFLADVDEFVDLVEAHTTDEYIRLVAARVKRTLG